MATSPTKMSTNVIVTFPVPGLIVMLVGTSDAGDAGSKTLHWPPVMVELYAEPRYFTETCPMYQSTTDECNSEST